MRAPSISALERVHLSECSGLSQYAREVQSIGPFTALDCDPLDMLSLALLRGLPTSQDAQQLLAFYAERGAAPSIQTLNDVTPQALEVLAHAGFVLQHVLHLYLHTLHDLPPRPSTVKLIAPQAWADLTTQGFGYASAAIMQANAQRRDVQRFAAFIGAQAVGAAALTVAGGVGAAPKALYWLLGCTRLLSRAPTSPASL